MLFPGASYPGLRAGDDPGVSHTQAWFSMADRLRKLLEPAISSARLESYRNDGDDLTMIVNYFHNLELSEAMYPSLQAFEVAYRNRLHDSLTMRYGTPFWFDNPDFAQSRLHAESVVSVRNGLRRDGKSHPLSADHIVSRLSFGFWHGLLNRPFERSLWRPDGYELIGEVFPFASRRGRSRQVLWRNIEQIRIIRNRVMHYEPIWHRPRLNSDHLLILEMLGWISPEMQSAIMLSDRFDAVLHQGRSDIERRIVAEIHSLYPEVI